MNTNSALGVSTLATCLLVAAHALGQVQPAGTASDPSTAAPPAAATTPAAAPPPSAPPASARQSDEASTLPPQGRAVRAASVAHANAETLELELSDYVAPPEESEDAVPFAGPETNVFNACRNRYYPAVEVRALSDLPLTLMWTKLKGASNWQAAPAVGIDALSLWWAPLRPYCRNSELEAVPQEQRSKNKQATVFTSKKEMFLYVIAAANVSYMMVPKDTTITIGDPSNRTNVDVTQAISGAYLSGSIGAFFSVKWPGGGHGNYVGIGFLARVGAYFSNDPASNTQAIVGIGPALKISLF